jgi:hypothetical protein
MVTSDDERPFQFTLQTLFLVTTLTAFFLGLGIWLQRPLLFPTVAILLAGYGTWQGTRANRAGIVLAVIGAEVLTLFGYCAYRAGSDLNFHSFYIESFFALVGAGLLIFGGLIFLVSAYRWRSARWQNVFCCSVSLIVPLLWFLEVVPLAEDALHARMARRHDQNAATMQKLVDDVDAVCARLGRAPESEGELAALLGGAMPQIDLGSTVSPIHYSRLSPDRFQLRFGNANWNISVYDSQTPKRGWYEERF